MVQDLFYKEWDMDTSIDYKTIILGKDIKEKNEDVISMSVFICKWDIFVFEMQLIKLNTL